MVLAHGWAVDARLWRPVSAALRHNSGLPAVRVLRYDHRGHGRSDPVGAATMTLDRLADDLAALLPALVPDGPLVLAGHSMGGMTLIELARRHPGLVAERVAGIGLVATASGGLAHATLGLPPRAAAAVFAVERWVYASPLFTRRVAFSRHPSVVAPGLRWLLLGAAAAPDAVRITTRCVAGCRPATMAGFRPALAGYDGDAALRELARVPTAVLVGSRDRLTPVPAARRITAALPSAELTVYPGAGHMLPVERVAGVAARLAALVRAADVPKR